MKVLLFCSKTKNFLSIGVTKLFAFDVTFAVPIRLSGCRTWHKRFSGQRQTDYLIGIRLHTRMKYDEARFSLCCFSACKIDL